MSFNILGGIETSWRSRRSKSHKCNEFGAKDVVNVSKNTENASPTNNHYHCWDLFSAYNRRLPF